MSERINVPIPSSPYLTRIEVYYKGELNRTGSVAPGQATASVKLPSALSECEIRLIPCDAHGKPVGRGHVYVDESLKPEPPANTEPPCEPEEESGECCEGSCESSELVADVAVEVGLEKSSDHQLVEACDDSEADCDATVKPAPEECEATRDDKVYEYFEDINDKYPSRDED